MARVETVLVKRKFDGHVCLVNATDFNPETMVKWEVGKVEQAQPAPAPVVAEPVLETPTTPEPPASEEAVSDTTTTVRRRKV